MMEIMISSSHTTLAIVAELANLEIKVPAAEPEKASLIPTLREVSVVGVVLAVLTMLLKIKITTSSKHNTLSFLAFQLTFGMLI